MGDKQHYYSLKEQIFWAKRRGDYRETESLLRAAIREVSADPDDRPELSELLNRLANLYADMGDLTRAIETARADVEVCRQIRSDSRGLLGNALMFLAHVLLDSNQYAEAALAAEEGVRIYCDELGEGHLETARMRAVLIEAQQKLAQLS